MGAVEEDPGILRVAVAGEKRAVWGDVDVDGDGPIVEVEPGLLVGFEVGAGDPVGAAGAAGVLELIPGGRAIGGPELVAPDFVDHGAGVDFEEICAVGVDGPDAVVVLPGAFVAVHEDVGIGGGELEMIVPVTAGVERF